MGEVKRKSKSFIVDYKCPECDNGYLRPMGYIYTANPPLYPHKCNNNKCDFQKDFRDITYPYTVNEHLEWKA